MSTLLTPPAGDPRSPAEYTYDMERSGTLYTAQPTDQHRAMARAVDQIIAAHFTAQPVPIDTMIALLETIDGGDDALTADEETILDSLIARPAQPVYISDAVTHCCDLLGEAFNRAVADDADARRIADALAQVLA